MKNRKNKRIKSSKYKIKLDFSKVDLVKTEKIFSRDKEFFSRQLRQKKLLNPKTKELLKILASGAVIGLSFAIPTLPMAVAPFITYGKKFNKNYFSQTIDRLKKQKLVKIVEENGQTLVRITQAGRVRALRYKLTEMEIAKPKSWDKKWRIVIFDIPEKHKNMRDIFRMHLKLMDFYPLQKSVWVHPFPCFDEVEFLRQIYQVGINVTYIVAERIENAENIKSHFEF